MAKIKSNQYVFKDDYVIGICSDGTEFKIDIDDYKKVSEYTWWNTKGHIEGKINGKNVTLSRFILNVTGYKKVLVKIKFDYRKDMLFYSNKYVKCIDYYDVECFDGTNFKISIDDYDIVSKYTWHYSNGYIVGKVKKKEVKLHRFLLQVNDNEEVDHKNRNTMDNQRNNLRIVTRSINCINRKTPKSNTSGVKGVYKISGYNRYGVQINNCGKRIYLGSFNSFEDACKVRLDAEKIYHKNKYFKENKIDNQQPSLE